MIRCLPLLFILATVPATVDEEVGAKVMFGNRSMGVLQFSPGSEAKAPKKPVKKPVQGQRQRPAPEPPSDPVGSIQGSTIGDAGALTIGLRFWVQRVDDQGRILAEMGVGQIFRSGDRIQLIIESNAEGYLAVVQQGSDGRAGLLFPQHEVELGIRRIPAHTKIVLPGPLHSFTFDEKAGTERLLIVLLRDRQEFFALPLRREMEQTDLAAVRRLAAEELGAKNLLTQAFADPKEDPATYVVNRTGSAIVQEIALVHEK